MWLYQVIYIDKGRYLRLRAEKENSSFSGVWGMVLAMLFLVFSFSWELLYALFFMK
jgi:hypothetical protein